MAPRWCALAIATAMCACGGDSGAGFTLVSVADEIDIGRQANSTMRQQTPQLRDDPTLRYVAALGRRLATHAPGPAYPYSFSVADQPDINAFALPGGPVWVHRGVISAATNESQLASVLAHEVAHIAQRHSARQLTKATVTNWGLHLLGAVLGNSGGAGTAQVAAGLLANGAFLKFSRDDEREADVVGLQLMQRAGWDGRGMMELLELLRRERTRDPDAVARFLSTHPAPEDRIATVRAEVRQQGKRDAPAFQAIKARVGRLPPAPRGRSSASGR